MSNNTLRDSSDTDNLKYCQSGFHFQLLNPSRPEKLCIHLFITNSNCISKYQFGSREGHSTEHAMIAMVDTIRKKVDEGNVCALCSLDLRNALPSVHREKLLTKIKNKYNISDF